METTHEPGIKLSGQLILARGIVKKADAELIAHAPDLVAALEAAQAKEAALREAIEKRIAWLRTARPDLVGCTQMEEDEWVLSLLDAPTEPENPNAT